MATTFNAEMLNRLYAPGIATFTACDAPDITGQHPQAPHWLANHFLNSLLRSEYKNKYRQFAINQIYRAQTAFADYHEARNLTQEFLAKGNPNNPSSRSYFHSVARWESCLLNLHIFIDVMNKMKRDTGDEAVFKEGDGTPEQRAYSMANTVKHWGADILAGRHEEADTVPLWLTNLGLNTRSNEITYAELAALVSQIAEVASELQDAKTFANPGDA
jgi:hypothetical protein